MGKKHNIEYVKKCFSEDKRGYILLSDDYINNSSLLVYICPKHKNKGELKISFANFLKGRGCPYCAKRIKKTQEEYIEELKSVNGNIIVLEDYINLKTKIKHKCKICGYEWKVNPTNLLHLKQGCPKCSKHRKNISNEDFVKELKDVNPLIKPISKYKNSYTKIQVECLVCGNIWEAKPNNLKNGKGCPACINSKGELKIKEILDKNKIKYKKEYIFKDCKNINYLPFDFYLFDYNICIEYDGLQHYEPCTFGGISKEKAEENFNYCRLKDSIKNQYCIDNNIKLLRIPYWEYKNIENIIMSFLS